MQPSAVLFGPVMNDRCCGTDTLPTSRNPREEFGLKQIGRGGSEGQHALLHRVSLSSHCRRDHFGPHPEDPAVLPDAAGHAEAAEAKAGIALRASSKGQPGVRDSRCAGYVSHITNLYKTLKDFSNCVTHLPD